MYEVIFVNKMIKMIFFVTIFRIEWGNLIFFAAAILFWEKALWKGSCRARYKMRNWIGFNEERYGFPSDSFFFFSIIRIHNMKTELVFDIGWVKQWGTRWGWEFSQWQERTWNETRWNSLNKEICDNAKKTFMVKLSIVMDGEGWNPFLAFLIQCNGRVIFFFSSTPVPFPKFLSKLNWVGPREVPYLEEKSDGNSGFWLKVKWEERLPELIRYFHKAMLIYMESEGRGEETGHFQLFE